ncbi:hypothetical protein BC940DRAFT_288375 [Gongronella butleri]|nr:hypothetical protein BC940DRAFT_288375 [Gongronella butleri]
MSDMDVDMCDGFSDPLSPGSPKEMPGQPTKVRKKPGRKPNPASPALRKAQNRAAQRAFRERKERHLRELEVAVKQMREQRDKLYVENEQLKADLEIVRSENWYMKGILLTLQLVCYQHNLVIPQHSPFINDQALSVMAQSTPEPIAAYLNVNANSKIPQTTHLSGYRHVMKQQRDRYLSQGTIVVTKDDISITPHIPPMPALQQAHPPPTSAPSPIELSSSVVHPLQLSNPSVSPTNTHQTEDYMDDSEKSSSSPTCTTVSMVPPLPSLHRQPTNEPVTSNLAAIQTLRLRLRLQSACARLDSVPFNIQPTVLQLTIPHDPRIDLIPTPHMRDRMILFREQFDLDDCFRCLLSGSVFHGGDPAIAANWELPKAFFEKYWFLTIDYTLRRTTNRWRRLQGLNDLEHDLDVRTEESMDDAAMTTDSEDQQSHVSKSSSDAALENIPSLERSSSWAKDHPSTANLPRPLGGSSLSLSDLSSYLGIEFSKLEQLQKEQSLLHAANDAAAAAAASQQANLGTIGAYARDALTKSDGTIPLHPPVPFHTTHSATTTSVPVSNTGNDHDDAIEPIRLTNGYLLPSDSEKTSPQSNTSWPPASSSPATTLTQQTTPQPLQDNMDTVMDKQAWDKLLLESNMPTYGKKPKKST